MELENGDTLSTSVENDYELLTEPFGIAQGVTIPTGGYTFSNVGGSYQLGVQHLLRGTVRANAGTFYDGTRRTAGFSGRLDGFGRIILEPSISANWIALPFGDFTTALLVARTTYTLSPRTNLGALVQYSSSSHSVSVNARFQWEYTPGSDFFVVYTEGRSTIIPDRLAVLQNRAFVVKLTRLFRY